MSQFPIVNRPTTGIGGAAGGVGTLGRIATFSAGRNRKSCPNCGDRAVIVFDSHSGDELCSGCGLVLEARVLSDEQEWRSFSNTDGGGGADRSRVGGPTDTWMEDGTQGTTMLGGDKKHSKLVHSHELATARSAVDRQLHTAFNNLQLVAESFSLRDNVVERCKEIVKDLQSAGQLRNRTGTLYMLSAVYIACREEGTARSVKELVIYDRALTERELGRAINRLKKMLPARNQPVAFAAPELMGRFCSRLQLSQQVINVAEHVCRKAEQIINRSHRPNSMAAGAIYLVTQLCDVKTDPADIAAVARTGESTVLSVYREMQPFLKVLLPSEFKPGSVAKLAP